MHGSSRSSTSPRVAVSLDVEEDEQHRHKVKLHGHAAGALALGEHAAFVGGVLDGLVDGGALAEAFADQPRKNQIAARESRGDEAQY